MISFLRFAAQALSFAPAPAPAPALPALSIVLWMAFAAASVTAQEASRWSEDHASRARLIVGGQQDQSRLIGLQILMEEGYKTYWRHPGDSGLPPDFDWEGSLNVADLEVLFPAPHRYEDASGVFFGYADEVIFPIRVTPVDAALPMRLSLSLEYGVCKEICIPARAELELSPGEPAPAHVEAVAERLSQVPTRRTLGDPGDLAVISVEAGETGHLVVGVRAPPDALLFAEGPDHRWFLAPEEMMRAGAQAGSGEFLVELAERPSAVEKPARLLFTLSAGGRAIETVVEIAPDAFSGR